MRGHRRCQFQLARKPKRIPDLTASRIEETARRWWRLAYDKIGTKDVEVTVADFLTAYDCVRHPDESDPVRAAAGRARLRPTLKCMSKCKSKSMQLLASVCYELSLARGI